MNNHDNNRLSKISFFILFLIVILVSFKIVSNFLLAIIVGAIFAQLVKPLHNKLVENKINAKFSAYLILILFVIILIVPLFFFIRSFIAEASWLIQFISSSDISFSSIANDLKKWPIFHYFISDPSSLEIQLKSLASSVASRISNVAIYFAPQIPKFIIDTIFILLSIFVFLLHTDKIIKYVSNLIPIQQYLKNDLIRSSYKTSKMAIFASLLAALAQTIMCILGFVILNVPNVFLAAGGTFLFSFIPILGSTPVWVAGITCLIFKGSVIKIIFMIIFGIIAGFIDNIIRAYVLKGSKGGMHPLIGFISVIGGIQVFGFLGVLIGPIVVALLLSMCKVWPSVLEKTDK
jgi:predicted PurR-regulated permease PerM